MQGAGNLLTGATATTPENLTLGSAVMYLTKPTAANIETIQPIGAFTGDVSVVITPTITNLGDGINGLPVNTKGYKAIFDYEEVSVAGTIVETTLANLGLAIAGSVVTATKITGSVGIIKSDSYHDIYVVGKGSDSKLRIVTIKNCLNTDGLTYVFVDKNKGSVALKFYGHFDPANLSAPPFEIEVLDAGAGTLSAPITMPKNED